jgi:hypothetical protein
MQHSRVACVGLDPKINKKMRQKQKKRKKKERLSLPHDAPESSECSSTSNTECPRNEKARRIAHPITPPPITQTSKLIFRLLFFETRTKQKKNNTNGCNSSSSFLQMATAIKWDSVQKKRVEYATTGHSNVSYFATLRKKKKKKTFSQLDVQCKICRGKIDKNSVRVGLGTKNDGEDDLAFQYYHLACFPVILKPRK